MTINGAILIGNEDRQNESRFYPIWPETGERSPQHFSEASARDVADAAALSADALARFAALEPGTRADFLDAVAQAILDIGEPLIEAAMAESGLPRMRLEGERGRTTGQLRMFANELRAGAWLDVTIAPALPDRTPPRSDLRRMNVAIGPVAIFGASNFPLAFSVAGGDTASALAAGCPVIVKGHPAHPATGELVARAIRTAVVGAGLPAGVFSYLPGSSHDLGQALVADPRIQAVGFTGSRAGGLALIAAAAARAVPIPVYAEMSSINPVVLMPGALDSDAEALGRGFVGSLTLGVGQFCTNPGLLLAVDSPALDRFIAAAAEALAQIAAAPMLTPGIHAAYCNGVAALGANAAVKTCATAMEAKGPNRCRAMLFETRAAAFLAQEGLRSEIFGACALLVRCCDLAEMQRVIAGLEGQLTATLHFDTSEARAAKPVMDGLSAVAGRVLANGWPTGVEVHPAMVHGGPFPASSHPGTTSVGTLALRRFVRPVCFQDIDDALLPPALQDANPWSIPRHVG